MIYYKFNVILMFYLINLDQDQSDSDKEPSEEEGEEGGEEDDNEEYTDVPDLQIIGTPIFRRMPEGLILFTFYLYFY